jgi:hypothetical protein
MKVSLHHSNQYIHYHNPTGCMVSLEVISHLPVKEVYHGNVVWQDHSMHYAEKALLTLSDDTNDAFHQLGWLRKEYFILGIGHFKHNGTKKLAFGLSYSPELGVTNVVEIPIEKILNYKKN